MSFPVSLSCFIFINMKPLGLTPEKTDKFKIAKKTLPVEEMKLVMFDI